MAFSDRTYVWRNTPYELQGLNFTQIPGHFVFLLAFIGGKGEIVVSPTHMEPTQPTHEQRTQALKLLSTPLTPSSLPL